MRPRIAWTLAAAGAALASLLSCALAIAAPVVSSPVAPDHEVRWGESVSTELAPLPAGTREVELLLISDDGRQSVRVSPECDARAGVIHWRMPRINARRARLVLRAGSAAGERESEPSGEFAIAAPHPAEATALRRGDSDLGWRIVSHADASATMRAARERASLDRGGANHAIAPAPASPAALPPTEAGAPRWQQRAPDRPSPRLDVHDPTPARVPMRN